MNFALPTISCFLMLLNTAVAAPQQPVPQSGQLNQRDLEIQKLPGEQKTNTTPVVPRGYAVVIGIAQYEKLAPEDKLKFPETDAEAIYRVLISKQGGAFMAENVHLLVGRQATLQNIRHEIEAWLPSVAEPQDQVVVYFAGHGFVKDGKGYLAPWDVDPARPETTAYPMKQLGNALAENVKAKWKLLLMDACHSEKVTPETTNEAVDAQISQLPKGFPGGFLILSATRASEKSYEDSKLSTGFGVFTYFLVQGLQGEADRRPCDGVITADELIDYVRNEVRDYTMERNVIQTPTDHGDFRDYMVLSGNPACANPASLPTPISSGSLVIDTNMDAVEVYVDDRLIGTVDKGKPLLQPGLAAGVHSVRGVREGYEPVTKEIEVIPGQEKPVILRIQYRRVYKSSAMDLVDRGEKLLFKRPSSFLRSGRQRVSEVQKARRLFDQALKEEPNYPLAAYDLALACQQLSDCTTVLSEFRRAVALDPASVDARVEYAGALIEHGDPDEAIRQLTEALRIAPDYDEAYSLLARAYLDKEVWGRAIEAASKAIALNRANYEPYLWKADALRRQAPAETDPSLRPTTYLQAVDSYQTFLALTDFSVPTHAKLLSVFVGFGLGHRSHADRQASYVNIRSFGLMGLCDCEDKLGNLRRATDYCQRAIKYDSKEPLAYFFLGGVYTALFNQTQNPHYLKEAKSCFAKVIELDPTLEQSDYSKKNIRRIDQALLRMH